MPKPKKEWGSNEEIADTIHMLCCAALANLKDGDEPETMDLIRHIRCLTHYIK